MQLDDVSRIVVGFLLERDENNILVSINHSDDPDFVPDELPVCTYVFAPIPFQRAWNEFMLELTFWYNNPELANISRIIDELEKRSEMWWDANIKNQKIGRYQYFFLRSPLTGGRNNAKFITLFLKLRVVFLDQWLTCFEVP